MLDRFAFFGREGTAKGLVATHDFGNRRLQVSALNRAREAQGTLNMVDWLPGFELFEKPKALLRERERSASGVPPPETARLRASADFGTSKPFGDEAFSTRFPCENWFRDRHGSWVK